MRLEVEQWGWRTGLVVCLLVVAGAVFSDELSFFVAPDPRVLFEGRVHNFELWPRTQWSVENDGFVRCSGGYAESGWCLPPGGKGAIRYTLPETQDTQGLLLHLYFFRHASDARSRVLVYREGEAAPRFAFANVDFAGARLNLSRALTGQPGRVVLHFEGENPTPKPDVVFQFLEVRLFADALPPPPSIAKMTFAVLVLGLSLFPLVPWRRLVPLSAIFALGFALRYYALQQVLFLPLVSDADGYYSHAMRMSPFTETGFFSARFGYREPVFVLVIKGFLWLLGNSETHVRLASFFSSLLVIVLSYQLSAKLFGTALGFAGAFLVAITLPLVRESVEGLRLDVELVLLLVFLGVAFLKGYCSPWFHASIMGLTAGVLTLTRMTYLITLPPLLLLAILTKKPRRVWAAGVALLIMVSLQLPHRLNTYRLHGDPFYDASQTLREGVHIEFPDRDITTLTARQYYFDLHTIPELTLGTARGFWKAIRHMEVIAFHRAVKRVTGLSFSFADYSFQLAGVFGLILAIVNPSLRWIPLAFLLLLLPIAYLYDGGFSEPLRFAGIGRRHIYQAFPLMVFGSIFALSTVIRFLARSTARRNPN